MAFFLTKIIAPDKPNVEKLTSYECGEEPEGTAWIQFNPKFYVIALVFLLFDVEMVFVLPWATVFGNHNLIANDARWGWYSLAEMFVFIGILLLGLVYVWAKGDLDWIKAKPVTPTVDTKIPQQYYDRLNLQQSAYMVKPFVAEAEKVAVTATETISANPAAVRKPMFKPTFKKPDNE